MEMWNVMNVVPPPRFCLPGRDKLVIAKLREIISDAVRTLSSTQSLHKEAGLLSRVLYKANRKFRRMKGMMYFRKVNCCLRRYLQLKLDVLLKELLEFISCEEMKVPTRQMVQFVVVRMQGFAKLMHFIVTACQNAAKYVEEYFKYGRPLVFYTVIFPIMSRIWYFSNILMFSACQWCTNLIPFLKKLKPYGEPLLPDNYQFPDNILSWLGPVLTTQESFLRTRDSICQRMWPEEYKIKKDGSEVSNGKTELCHTERRFNKKPNNKKRRSTSVIASDGTGKVILNGKTELGVTEEGNTEKCILRQSTSEIVCEVTTPTQKELSCATKMHKHPVIHKKGYREKTNLLSVNGHPQKVQEKVKGKVRRAKLLPDVNLMKPKEAGKDVISSIKSVACLKIFLLNEKKARLKNRDCITSKLTASQWISLKKTVKKLVQAYGGKGRNVLMSKVRNVIKEMTN